MSKRQIREKGDRENDGGNPERRGRMEIKCATIWKICVSLSRALGREEICKP